MPYGVDKKKGGDSPSNTKWIERCVSKVRGDKQGNAIDKGRAIAICKSQLRKSKSNTELAEILVSELILDE